MPVIALDNGSTPLMGAVPNSPKGRPANDDNFSGLSIRSAIGEPWCGVEIVVSERIAI